MLCSSMYKVSLFYQNILGSSPAHHIIIQIHIYLHFTLLELWKKLVYYVLALAYFRAYSGREASNFFQPLITPLSLGLYQHVIPLINAELRALSEYCI